MAFIRGLDRGETFLLPPTVDDFIGRENPARAIDAFVDSLDLRALGFGLRDDHAVGRASYHPAMLLKLHLWGYLRRARSSRRLEEAAAENLSAIWLTGNLRPDHSTISRFRKGQSGAIAQTFGQCTLVCLELGLFGREPVAIDGTFIKAVNSRTRSYTEGQLRKLIEKIDLAVQHYLDQLEAIDREGGTPAPGGGSGSDGREDLGAKLDKIRQRRPELQAHLEGCREGEGGQISLTDPDSRLLHKNGKTTVGYNVQAAVDDKHHLVVACEVTRDGNDLGQLQPMARQAKEGLGLAADAPLEALADTGYHCGAQLAGCREDNTEAFVPARAPKSNGGYKEADFVYHPATGDADAPGDHYACPNGQVLSRKKDGRRANGQPYLVYAAATASCKACPAKGLCTKKRARELRVSIHKEAIDEARERMEGAGEMASRRGSLAEHPFGTFKDITGGRDLLGKGMGHAIAEVRTTFWSYNFGRALDIMGMEALMGALVRGPGGPAPAPG